MPTTITQILTDIRALSPDDIRARLASLDAEQRELRRILRLRMAAEGGKP
jgi:ribosomal protein L29